MHTTEQERFWAGEFGTEYLARNAGEALIAANTALFARILAHTHRVESVLELGANIGLNLMALRALLPDARLEGVEINKTAFDVLTKIPRVHAHHASLFGFRCDPVDFAFTKGVLIHIDPQKIDEAYDVLYNTSRRYLCVAEYYNPTPIEIPYRGHGERLFKRDWCADLSQRFRDLRLIDYGFVYHGDTFALDDITWFLMEKVTL